MKILQIDVACNVTSTGRIAEGIGREVIADGGENYIAYGRYGAESKSQSFRIGTDFDVVLHGLYSRLFDRHGFASRRVTKNLIKRIDQIKPDIIHLHDIHGYYVNIAILFSYIKNSKIPVVWTQHCCWAFTGHCAHFDFVHCDKWKEECHHCIQKKEYPASFLVDNSRNNYRRKKKLFTHVQNMTVVTVSEWLGKLAEQSFLSEYPIKTLHNGVNVEAFKYSESNIRAKYNIQDKFLILGVASPWAKIKGLADFIKLKKICGNDIAIMLVGLNEFQMTSIPCDIIGIRKMDSVEDLAKMYSAADLFFNPIWEDSFSTTNLESLACGTPVATYRTGGSVEAVSEDTGFILAQGDVQGVLNIIRRVKDSGKGFYLNSCRSRALNHFRQEDRFKEYIDIYKSMLKTNKR